MNEIINFFNWWISIGVLALGAIYLVLSMVLVNRRLKGYRTELVYLNQMILRDRAVIQEMQLAVDFKQKQIQLMFLRRLAFQVGLKSFESKFHQLLHGFTDSSRLKIQQLFRNIYEHDSIEKSDKIETLLMTFHQDFITEYVRNNGDISQNEQFLIVLLHMGLNTEEVAALTGKSQEAISMAKWRLKQKHHGEHYWWL